MLEITKDLLEGYRISQLRIRLDNSLGPFQNSLIYTQKIIRIANLQDPHKQLPTLKPLE